MKKCCLAKGPFKRMVGGRRANLTPRANLASQKQIMGGRLVERRGADRADVLRQIGDDRADDPRIVDAAMLKEGAVLRSEESAHEQRRIFAVVELDAAFA